MAKSQKRSTRELRKPKASKGKAAVIAISGPEFPVSKLMKQPKPKL